MKYLNGCYTQYFNKTHKRVGHLFQGRYKSILVEKDSYLFELLRYIVLNPVRALLVKEARDWPWSSYTYMIGPNNNYPWLNTNELLSNFGNTVNDAKNAYIAFVLKGARKNKVIWKDIKNQIYFSDSIILELVKLFG